MTATHHTVELTGALTIRSAAALRDQLQSALAAADTVTLDCIGVTSADIAALQLLVAAQKSAAADGKAVRLLAPAGTALNSLLRQAGFLDPDGKPKAPDFEFWAGAHPSEAA
jgi:ABC-type transporter Mla MlaB component